MRADGRGRRECRGNARGPGRIRGAAPRGPGLPARSACARGTAGGAEPKPCRRWRLRRRKRRRVRPARAYVAREGEHPRRPDGRPRARGGGGLLPGALPRVRIEGLSEARDDRRPPPGGTGSDQPCGLSRRGPQGRRAEGGERERPSTRGRTPSRAEGSARQAPRRRDQPCGLSRDEGRTCAGEARGADARSAPAGPAGRRRTGARWSENQPCGLFERRRADGRRRQGSLCSFTPVAVDSAFSCENVRQNGGTRRCTSAIRHYLLCLIARRTGVFGRREKGKLFCLGALPAAPAPHFTLFRATVWRQREKVSTSGAQASPRTQAPCGSDGGSGTQGTWVRGCIAHARLRPCRGAFSGVASGSRLRLAAAGARGPSAHPGATAGAARRAVLSAPSSYPGCLRGSDGGSGAQGIRAPGKGRPARARAHGERRRERRRARARWGLKTPRAGGPREPWGGSHAQAPARKTLAVIREGAVRPRDRRAPAGSESSSGAACARFLRPVLGREGGHAREGLKARGSRRRMTTRRTSDRSRSRAPSEGLAPMRARRPRHRRGTASLASAGWSSRGCRRTLPRAVSRYLTIDVDSLNRGGTFFRIWPRCNII